MTAPRWDQPLSREEVKRLAPADKARRMAASLGRKILSMETEAARRDPENRRADLPRDRAKLRRWSSDDERLWTWVDPAFDSPKGRNSDLMGRFQAAVDRLDAQGRRGRSALREELRLLKLRNAQLDGQVATVMAQNRQLRAELSRAMARRA